MNSLRSLKDKMLNIIYSIPRVLFINFYRLFVVKIKVHYAGKLPENKSAIFAFNHTTGADPIIVLGALRKKIYFVADAARFKNRFSAFFMKNFTNSIPVFKEEFSKNLGSFKKLFSKTKSKKVFFGIFPEGQLRKDGKFGKFHGGAAYLSFKTRLPIIPVYIHNNRKGLDLNSKLGAKPVWEGIFALIANTFSRINVFIGDPIDPIAENMLEELREITDKDTYKEIIEKINYKLLEEFKELKDEAEYMDDNEKQLKNKTGAVIKEKLYSEKITDDDETGALLPDEIDEDGLIQNTGNIT